MEEGEGGGGVDVGGEMTLLPLEVEDLWCVHVCVRVCVFV